MSKTAAVLYEERVIRDDGCWGWRGSRDVDGYGVVRVSGRVGRAHRLSWELHKGPIPAGIFVLHHCDNPPCTNPEHLFLGTQGDNLRDMFAKGRATKRRASGERHHNARLTDSQVRELIARYVGGDHRLAVLAREFQTSEQTVWRIGTSRGRAA